MLNPSPESLNRSATSKTQAVSGVELAVLLTARGGKAFFEAPMHLSLTRAEKSRLTGADQRIQGR